MKAPTPTGLRSEDVASFDDRTDGATESDKSASVKDREKEAQIKLQLSAEEIKKKTAKKDEDPMISRFKNAEVEFYIYLNFNVDN